MVYDKGETRSYSWLVRGWSPYPEELTRGVISMEDVRIVLDSIQARAMFYDLYDIRHTCGIGVARLLGNLMNLDQESAVEIIIRALDDEEAEQSIDYHGDYDDSEEEASDDKNSEEEAEIAA